MLSKNWSVQDHCCLRGQEIPFPAVRREWSVQETPGDWSFQRWIALLSCSSIVSGISSLSESRSVLFYWSPWTEWLARPARHSVLTWPKKADELKVIWLHIVEKNMRTWISNVLFHRTPPPIFDRVIQRGPNSFPLVDRCFGRRHAVVDCDHCLWCNSGLVDISLYLLGRVAFHCWFWELFFQKDFVFW